jgi:DNA-3-methyladenine glycosylase
MYGPAGHAYVYFTYGMHWMLNFVTEPVGFPAAVLIRAVLIDEGLDLVSTRRNGRPPQHWTDGPAKLCQALNVDQRLNGADLTAPGAELFVAVDRPFLDSAVSIGPRVGLNTVPEPWKSVPWRFVIRES